MSEWEKEFDEKFKGAFSSHYDGKKWFDGRRKDLKQFIRQTRQQAKKDMANELLKKGHGSGNWRRLITLLMTEDDYLKEE